MDPVTASLMQEAGPSARRGGNPSPVRFTDSEEASNATDVRSPEAKAALEGELGRKNLHPVARAVLQKEFDQNFGQQARSAAPQQAANDPVTASLLGEAKSISDKSVPDQAPEREPYKEPSTWEKVKGAGEAALSVGTGLVAAPIGAAAGVVKGFTGGKYGTQEGAQEASQRAAEIAHSLTYEPRTEAGKGALETVGKVVDASKLAGLGPTEGMALSGVLAGPRAVSGAVRAEAPAGRVPGQMGSVGASGITPAEQAAVIASKASPELQKEVAKVGPKLTPQGLKTVERHVQSDSLPVPIKLTPGQATQDVGLLSTEQNSRASHEGLRNRFQEQNKQLVENLDAIREKAAPDVYATSRPEMGEKIIDAYKTKDAALNLDISAKYKALKDANGGQFPLDGKAFVKSADEALHKDLVYDHVPAGVRKTMDRLSEGGTMTFEQFEAMRTNLARIARSQADGNEKHAAAVIRDSLENMPIPPGAEHLKPLADAARSAARERFALIEKDPAYKAITKGKASADRFIEKYVVGADTQHVKTMKDNLAHDPSAQQTMTAGAMQRLKDRAGIMEGEENFRQAGYNKALESLRPKLGVLFDPESKTLVENLGSVARYVKGQPTGSFVNNSNSAVALMGAAAKLGATAAGDMAVPGLQAGTKIRKIAEFIKEKKDLNMSMKQYGGIKLKDVGR